jgi:hypothetical protein
MSRFMFARLLVLTLLVATLTALGVSLAFAEIDGSTTTEVEAVATLPPVIYLSSSVSGKVGGVTFRDEDIVVFMPDDETGTSGTWTMFFDGSDVGIGNADLNSFELIEDGTAILMTLDKPIIIPGLGRVDDSDILKFNMTVSGDSTAGSFELCFDGSLFDLTTSGEKIDALAFDENGRLLISTAGTERVNGKALKAFDEDLLAFSAAPFECNPASGSWEIYVDGSDLKLSAGSEDVNGAWVDLSVAEKNIYLSTIGGFRAVSNVNAVNGDGDDILGFTPFTFGEKTTTGFLFAAFDGDTVGQKKAIDGIFIAPVATSLTLQAAAASQDIADEDVVQYPVEANDWHEDDLTDAELDANDLLADEVDEEESVQSLYLPMLRN